MPLLLETTPLPLISDTDGVIRVTGTRISLDLVVESFQDGATPEEIAVQYPSLSLPVVYSVIGYFLQNQAAVNKYLRKRRKLADDIRRANESRATPVGVRERLLARQKRRE
ncbi:MAG: DUF433 domain-containing protein [Chloroflexi bacterium]|nr:MAG: DUF433 domain-containing protein [Chloroflexota bacterium]